MAGGLLKGYGRSFVGQIFDPSAPNLNTLIIHCNGRRDKTTEVGRGRLDVEGLALLPEGLPAHPLVPLHPRDGPT